MSAVTLKTQMEITEIYIEPGQTLTVCFDMGPAKSPRYRYVELRMLEDGVPQVFCDLRIPVESFEDWKPMDQETFNTVKDRM